MADCNIESFLMSLEFWFAASGHGPQHDTNEIIEPAYIPPEPEPEAEESSGPVYRKSGAAIPKNLFPEDVTGTYSGVYFAVHKNKPEVSIYSSEVDADDIATRIIRSNQQSMVPVDWINYMLFKTAKCITKKSTKDHDGERNESCPSSIKQHRTPLRTRFEVATEFNFLSV